MQRGLSSFDIYVIVSELQELLGSYIDKIYQSTRDELLIRINNKKTNKKEIIYIKNGELFCTTQKKFMIPQKPSTFAMTCRKYLLNGRITAITQHEFDRIIKIKIGKKEGEYTLIFELFKNGNIILADYNEKIILPLIIQQWAHRTIRSHRTYVLPPSQTNPFHINEKQFQDVLKESKKDLVRTLAVNINLSGAYAEEICFRADVDKNKKTNDLQDGSIKKIYAEFQKFLETFKEKKFTPTYVKKEQKIIDILPVPFQSYIESEFVKTTSFSRGLEQFIDIQITKKETKYQKRIEKLQRQISQQKQALESFKEKIKQKKIEGDIIYLNFQQCQELLGEITLLLQQKEKTEGIIQINSKNIVKSFDPVSNELIVCLQDEHEKTVDLKLDFRKTVSENAENAYQASKKFQEKLKGAEEALVNTRNQIKTLEEKDAFEKEKKIETGKQFWFERFRWFISKEGNIVVAGRDAKTNEVVVKKYLKEGDRYAHADVHGAPSCIVKATDIKDKNIPISEKTLEETCIFAASYSKAWKQFADAQAYWVLPEQVSKTPQSGEFLPKGAFIIRGKRNHYRCKVEIAVGEITIEDTKKIMAGPVESVKARSNKFIILQSGVMKKNVIAKKLAKIFDVPMEIIQRLLPPGDVTIVKTEGFELK
jgi:predicted ribosome quality control (RQC) complex YloA/Tae2 family protein